MDLAFSIDSARLDFNWTRFWAPIDVRIDEHDFLPDPEGFLGNKRIVPFERIKHVPNLILLGNPGIGKSRATQHIVRDLKAIDVPCLYVALHRYGTFERLEERLRSNEVVQQWLNSTGELHLFLDGLDEARLNDKQFDHDIVHFLGRLTDEQHKRLFLRVTCRSGYLPNDFVQELEILRSSKQQNKVEIFQLAKLRQQDVVIAAAELSIEPPQAFLDSVILARATPFAAHPITLDMLFKIYQAEGQLPDRKTDIFAQGCWHLGKEVSDRRQQDGLQGEFDVDQRLTAARQLAAISVIGNRPRIYSGVDFTTSQDTIPLADCFLTRNTDWQRPEALLRETLRTALLMGYKPNYHLWSHRSYGEYLAADFIKDARMSFEQIKNLVVNPADPKHRVAPQLRETVTWLASMNSDVFDWIFETEPAILLNSDSVELTDKNKATLVNRFIQAHAAGVPEDHFLNWGAYGRFAHPSLGEELEVYLQDKSLSKSTRELTISIAIYCDVTTIDDVLIAIALDPNEAGSLRQGALSALNRPNHKSEILENLRPLIFSPRDYNCDQNIIARSLDILWPDHLSAEEVFGLIDFTQVDNNGIDSTYEVFLGNLAIHLEVDDLPIALNWLSKNMPDRDIDLSASSGDLTASILSKAWDHLDIEAVRIAFARIAWERLRSFSGVMYKSKRFLYYGYDKVERNYAEELRQDTSKRRQLLLTMLGSLSPEQLRNANILSDLKESGDLEFVTVEDISWLMEQIQLVDEDNVREAFLILIELFFPEDRRTIFYGIPSETVLVATEVYGACGIVPLIADRFRQRFEAVPRDSERAEQGRRWVAERNELIARQIENTPERVSLRTEIETWLAKCKDDSINWWVLDQWLRVDEFGRRWDNIWDSRQGDGWKSIQDDEAIIAHIVDAAFRYLVEQHPYICDYEEGTPISDWFPAMAGYRALILLETGTLLDQLTSDDWERWADAIVFNLETKPQEIVELDSILLKRAFSTVPDKLLIQLEERLGYETEDYHLYQLLKRYHYAPKESLKSILLDYLNRITPEENAFFTVVQFAAAYNIHEIEAIVVSYLELLSSSETGRNQQKRIIRILAGSSKTTTWWPAFWSLLQNNPDHTEELLQAIIEYRRNPYLRSLNEEELFSLFQLAIELFPHTKDKEFRSGTIPGWYANQKWRDNVLEELSGRGTKSGIGFLETVANQKLKPPNMDYLLEQAWERYCVNSWVPPQPATILQLAANNQKLYPRSAKQLLDLVIIQLKQIENDFKSTQNKRYALWHPQTDGSFWPVEREERFANAIAEWLGEKLPRVIINREPQVHHGLYSSQGDNTDITVETFSDTDEQLTIIIEVKCCWYKRLLQKMQEQLVDQYLSNHPHCRDGIYLVGYFASNNNNWSKSDSRRDKLCARWSKEQLYQDLIDTKEQLNLPVPMTVEVFLFDASIEEAKPD